ncbi:hypothetical protein [Paraferrimonas sp. SM1919]|uniref:hypothetical protein n=1 Tax=Paraferrimonas sp. SM1919 TaxID=2662263 RepID=UPI0013D223E9|nr:hypothetical protein [Paraferrimonas sp. SM1919]
MTFFTTILDTEAVPCDAEFTSTGIDLSSEDELFLLLPRVYKQPYKGIKIAQGLEKSIPEMVEHIISSFGIPVKDFEVILGVKRASIYSWKNGVHEPQGNVYYKLYKLYNLSKSHGFDGTRLGRAAKTIKMDGTTFIEKLSKEMLNFHSIDRHYQSLRELAIKRAKFINGASEYPEDNTIVLGSAG